jgi:hypothetical protein
VQIWVFFDPGTGGDGIVNLLERSTNTVPIDEGSDCWRVHRLVDGQIKFYAPSVDQNHCFRTGKPFRIADNYLRSCYVDAVHQERPCVVASHDVSLDLLRRSDSLEILTKKQIKVRLTNNDPVGAAQTASLKNLLPFVSKPFLPVNNFEQFDYVIDVERFQQDWNMVKKICDSVGLDLDRDQYLQYQDLLRGNFTYMSGNSDIEMYKSKIDGTRISYQLESIYQPTQTNDKEKETD